MRPFAMLDTRTQALVEAARLLGAVPSDMPGLWLVAGHPELTEGQLLDLARQTALRS